MDPREEARRNHNKLMGRNADDDDGFSKTLTGEWLQYSFPNRVMTDDIIAFDDHLRIN